MSPWGGVLAIGETTYPVAPGWPLRIVGEFHPANRKWSGPAAISRFHPGPTAQGSALFFSVGWGFAIPDLRRIYILPPCIGPWRKLNYNGGGGGAGSDGPAKESSPLALANSRGPRSSLPSGGRDRDS